MWILPRNQKKNKNNRFLLRFFHSQIRMKTKITKKEQSLHPSYAIFICLIEMKTKAKTFFDTILLFVILLCDSCFIVRYMFLARYLTATFEWRPSKLEKKGISRLPCMRGSLNFPLMEAKSQWGDANYRWGTRPYYNLSTGFISIHRLWPCFVTTIRLRCEISISC